MELAIAYIIKQARKSKRKINTCNKPVEQLLRLSQELVRFKLKWCSSRVQVVFKLVNNVRTLCIDSRLKLQATRF